MTYGSFNPIGTFFFFSWTRLTCHLGRAASTPTSARRSNSHSDVAQPSRLRVHGGDAVRTRSRDGCATTPKRELLLQTNLIFSNAAGSRSCVCAVQLGTRI